MAASSAAALITAPLRRLQDVETGDHRICQETTEYRFAEGDLSGDREVATAHVVFSSISIACCVVLLLTAAAIEPLRRFPKPMLLWKTACDLLTGLIIVIINGLLLSASDDDYLDRGQAICRGGALAGIVGFSLLASPGWFFALAFNLNRSL